MNLILFESNNIKGLLPFSFNHSPLELRVGAFTNFQRIERLYKDRNIIVIVRDNLKDVIQDRFPDLLINPDIVPKGICLNTSAIFEGDNVTYLVASDIPSSDVPSVDGLESYNDLVSSSSISRLNRVNILNSIFSESVDNINVDYRELENHSFFGSAELKLRNFLLQAFLQLIL